MYEDSTLKTIKTLDKKVEAFSIDVNYPTYRRFKVDETVLFKKDTIKTRNYYTLINENGKWKVIWTNTLSSFADQKSFNGDCAGARKTVEKIIEINPFDGSAYDLLACCYYRDNSLPRSEWEDGIVKNIKYALTLEEDCSNHYNIFAAYYSSMREYDLAIQCRLNALRYCLSEQDKTILYSNIGNSYMSLSKYDDAFVYFKKAVDINPSFPDVWFRLGMLMEYQNNIDKAMEYFERALSLSKMENVLQGFLYFEYAKCSLKVNRYNTAKEYINKALMVDPSNESYQYLYKIIQYYSKQK
jgi:tetratricopeptide (TPR) repeat protein